MDKEKVDAVQEREDHVNTRQRTIGQGKKSYSVHKSCHCMDCGKSFTRKSSLIVHQRIHTGEKLFMCSECGKKFGLKSSMVRHMRTHNPKTLKICPDCGKCFSRYSSLFQHQKVHKKERLYRCPYCEKSFTRASQLVVHQRIHKRRSLPERAECEETVNGLDKQSIQKSIVCLECGEHFREHRSLVRHRRIHKDPTTVPTNSNDDGLAHDIPFNINDCNAPQALQMANRLDEMRGGSVYVENKTRGVEKRVLCMDCGKSFTRKSSLIVHQRIHTGEKRFMCSECGKRFGLKSSMVRHMRTHSPKILLEHQKLNRREKPFKCRPCEKSFSRASQLVVHERYHKTEILSPKSEPEGSNILDKENGHFNNKNSEDSHKCLECGKCFRLQTAFRRHQRMHKGHGCLLNTQNSVFRSDAKSGTNCSISDPVYEDEIEAPKKGQPEVPEKSNPDIDKTSYIVMKFGENTCWKTSREVKNILCIDCGKSFTRKSSLIVHQRIHTGEKLFMCADCGKRFSLKSSLVRHMRTHSPKSLNICSDCGKCFSRYSSLFQHQKVHRREKPYKCPQCERSFSRASQLLFHRRTHKVEESYFKAEPGEGTDEQHKRNHYVIDPCPEEPHVYMERGKCFREQHRSIRHHVGDSSSYTEMKHNADSRISHLDADGNCKPSPEINVKKLKSENICNVAIESEKVGNRASAIDNSTCKPRLSCSRRAYHCIQCGKNFTRKSSLIVHQRIHTGEKLFICTECGKRFGFKSSLVRHLKSHTGQMFNICSECGIYFSRYCDLLLHLENHTGQLQITRNPLSKMEALDEPRNAHKGGETVPLMKEQESSLQHDQPLCATGYELPRASSINDYFDPHCEEKILEGMLKIKQESSESLCVESESTKNQKNENVCTVPSSLSERNEGNISESFIEGYSGKTVKTRNHSERPILDVRKNHNLGGGVCDGSDHLLRGTLSTVKCFLCSECGKNYTRKSSLIVHQRIHTGEKLFMCSECGKRFGLKSSMVRHMRTHKAECFLCMTCGTNFRDYSKFLEHQTSHSGELPYTEPL